MPNNADAAAVDSLLHLSSASAVFCGCGAALIGYCKPSSVDLIFGRRIAADNNDGFVDFIAVVLAVLTVAMIITTSVVWSIKAIVQTCETIGRFTVAAVKACQTALLSSIALRLIDRLSPLLNLFRTGVVWNTGLRMSSIAVIWTAVSSVRAIQLQIRFDAVELRWMFVVALVISIAAILLFATNAVIRPALRWIDGQNG